MKIKLFYGDCLEKMKNIPNDSIDLILADPPYGIGHNEWDKIIPFKLMWIQLKRIRKEKTPIVLFGSEPFSSALRMSNIKEFKYDWIWDKINPSGFQCLNVKYQPIRRSELISVFGPSATNYNPQMELRNNVIRNPTNIICFSKMKRHNMHPTQKPLTLIKYLIKTYTKKYNWVLDFCMGSGTTGLACRGLDRNFIGIEKVQKYFNISRERIGVYKYTFCNNCGDIIAKCICK